MTKSVRVAMVQDNFVVGDIRANTRKIIELAQSAAGQGADLVIFPELALTGYPPEDLLYRPGFLTPVSYTHLTLPTIILPCRSRWSPDH